MSDYVEYWVTETYVQRAPNGDWLVLQGGQQDRLLAITKSKTAAVRLQKKFDRQAA